MIINRLIKILTHGDDDFTNHHPSLIRYHDLLGFIKTLLILIDDDIKDGSTCVYELDTRRCWIIEEAISLEKEALKFKPAFSRDWGKEKKFRAVFEEKSCNCLCLALLF